MSGWAGRALALGVIALLSASCEWPNAEGTLRCECGAPPPCGQACQAKCGCCPINASACAPDGIIVGRGNCYDFTPCSGSDRCVMGKQGPVCAESSGDCEDVRTAYEGALAYSLTVRSGAPALAAGPYRDIQCPNACTVSPGHCAQGLDTCWILQKYFSDQNPELDRLANLYQSLGCPSLGPCSCPPVSLTSCEFDTSMAQGDYRGPLTCMVH